MLGLPCSKIRFPVTNLAAGFCFFFYFLSLCYSLLCRTSKIYLTSLTFRCKILNLKNQGDLDDALEITAVWCRNVKKTELNGGHLGVLAAILDWQWILISLYSKSIICTNFGTFITKWTIDTHIVIFYHFSQSRQQVVICKLFHKSSINFDQIWYTHIKFILE